MNKKKIAVTLLEIALTLSLIVIIPYDLRSLFGDNVVSAANPQKIMSGLQSYFEKEENKVNTCVESIDGSVCQQMPKRSCDELCKSGCIEKKREEVPECKLGTCIDEEEGLCTPRTPISLCEEEGGKFDERELESIPECQKRCCMVGDEARFVTKGQCDVLAERYGTNTIFKEDIASEPECIFLSVGAVEGACVLPQEKQMNQSDCRRTTLQECNNLGGLFHDKTLCSNPALNTTCERQKSVSCMDDLDEVYWIDSCGNEENIFSSDRDGSWNSGKILEKNESCSIGNTDNLLANQRSCGNCDRFLGSKCGNITAEKKLAGEPAGDVICKDLGCDVNGTRRENGETWCVYQNAIGTSLDVPAIGALGYFQSFHVPGLRSLSAPGGRHFRQSCVESQVITEECADYRNEVCTETRTNKTNGGKSLSVASCRPNAWAECLNYNSDGGSPLGDLLKQMQPIIDIVPQAGKILQGPLQSQKAKTIGMMFRCENNPDCYVNSVSVGKDYKFPLCLPKYPPGFYSHDQEGDDQNICGFGNQQCTSVWVYESIPFTFGLAAEWKCKAGCECVDGSPPGSAKGSWDGVYPSKKLADQSKDICVSLGDCGMKANYKGEGGMLFNSGYKFKIHAYDGMPKEDPPGKPKEVSKPKLMGVDDSKPIPSKYIDADYKGLFGTVEEGGSSGSGEGGAIGPKLPSFKPADPTMASLALTGVTGATALGSWAAVAAMTVPAHTAWVPFAGSVMVPAQAAPASLVAFSAGAMGAAIGAAVVSLLVGFSPVGQGVGIGGTIAYGVAGAASGAMMGVAVHAGGWGSLIGAGSGGPAWLGPAGLIIMVVVIVDIIAQWLSGVGSIKTVVAVFECGLWQPPRGSQASCEKCGDDGFPCSRYSCETLGKDCEFVESSEGFAGENGTNLCVYKPKNDVTGPIIISVNEEALTTGFGYENEDLGKASSSFEIRKKGTDGGCVNQLESFAFGFGLDEYGECRFAFEPDKDFEEMTQFGSSLLSKAHSETFSMTEVPFEGEEKKEMIMYIKCKDYSSGEEGGNIGGENHVKFCIDPIDLTAPVVVSETNQQVLLPYNTKTYILRVEFNEEVSEARAGLSNLPYDQLEYAMTCSGKICSAEVPLDPGTNTYFIKAKDVKGNMNEEGTPIVIRVSEDALIISSVSPDGDKIKTGEWISSVDLEANTEGGVDGSATCLFSINNGNFQAFKETGGTKHKQKLDRLTEGTYNIKISCADLAGNEANGESNFSIEVDKTNPEVTRVYDDSGRLVVITKERTTCGYSPANCNFKVNESSLMEGNEFLHSVALDYNVQYYIKCRDENGNEPSKCSIIVKGTELHE